MESVVKILEDAREDGMSISLNVQDFEGLTVKGNPKAEKTWIGQTQKKKLATS